VTTGAEGPVKNSYHFDIDRHVVSEVSNVDSVHTSNGGATV
jgi:hypothetical protein